MGRYWEDSSKRVVLPFEAVTVFERCRAGQVVVTDMHQVGRKQLLAT